MTSVATALIESPKLLPLPLQRILVVEDDNVIQAELQQLFQPEGYSIEIASRGSEGLELLRNAPPSVLVLDLHVADASPRRLFERMQFLNPSLPIVILGPPSVIRRVLFLELGAADYVVKPFNPRELLARVRAVMRRSQNYSASVFAFGDVQVDFRKLEVRRQGRPVPLTVQEFKLLKFMIHNAERTILREELLNEVWGYQNYPTTRTVDNHILKLRHKLEPQPANPVHFLTIHGFGYKFVPQGSAGYLDISANWQARPSVRV